MFQESSDYLFVNLDNNNTMNYKAHIIINISFIIYEN